MSNPVSTHNYNTRGNPVLDALRNVVMDEEEIHEVLESNSTTSGAENDMNVAANGHSSASNISQNVMRNNPSGPITQATAPVKSMTEAMIDAMKVAKEMGYTGQELKDFITEVRASEENARARDREAEERKRQAEI